MTMTSHLLPIQFFFFAGQRRYTSATGDASTQCQKYLRSLVTCISQPEMTMSLQSTSDKSRSTQEGHKVTVKLRSKLSLNDCKKRVLCSRAQKRSNSSQCTLTNFSVLIIRQDP
eukprot:3129570-Amphidinium_carterae.1